MQIGVELVSLLRSRGVASLAPEDISEHLVDSGISIDRVELVTNYLRGNTIDQVAEIYGLKPECVRKRLQMTVNTLNK